MACKITDTAKLEICCFNLLAVEICQLRDIQCIELCIDYPSGGLFPGKMMIRNARTIFPGTISVMIRPTPTHFVYTKDQFKIMHEQIKVAVGEGADGLTIGGLTSTRKIPNLELADLLSHVPKHIVLTFHRAFDQLSQPIKHIDQIHALGFHRILSAGGTGDAVKNAQILHAYHQFAKEKLDLVAAGGLKPEHVPTLKQAGISCFHAAAGGSWKDVLDPNVLESLQKSVFDYA